MPAEVWVDDADAGRGTSAVRVTGELDGAYADELYGAISSAQATTLDDDSVVIDLTDCAFIDSSAIGVLLRSATAGPALSIVGAAGQVRRALDLTGIEFHPGIQVLGS